MPSTPLPIAFVLDDRLSREKTHILARSLSALRQEHKLELFPGDISEAQLLKKLQETPFQLVIAPWYRYLAWNRIEAFLGTTRTSGPTFAGYFAEPVPFEELTEKTEQSRAILLDLSQTSAAECNSLIRALLNDATRTGIRPLIEPSTQIYCDIWPGENTLGSRIDAVLGIPELRDSEWKSRAGSIRVALSALWGLVFEDGHAPSSMAQAITSKAAKAYFQVAADSRALVFRACFATSAWSGKDAVRKFWPDAGNPFAPQQILMRFADLLRVHCFAESSDVEIVVGFLPSKPAETAPFRLHTLWIEPITARLVTETPFLAPGVPKPEAALLRQLPLAGADAASFGGSAGQQAKDRALVDAATRIRDLQVQLREKDALIRELKSGGVGTAQPLPPPDAEALLEGFRERFLDTEAQIQQLEAQVSQASRTGADKRVIETLRQKIAALSEREKAWIRMIASILEAKKGRKTGTGG